MAINQQISRVSPLLNVSNPYTNNVITTIETTSPDSLQSILDAAQRGAKACRALARYQRANILTKTAQIVSQRSDGFATTIVQESGKTITQARKEVARCINTLELSAEEAKRHAGEVIPFDSYEGAAGREGYTHRDPLGIIAAITPFNDPLNLVAHKLGPAIAGGNAVILKPSELTPLSAIKLVNAFVEAGLNEDIISVVIGDAALGEALIASEQVRMVSFTGGMKTGEAITRQAGLKKMAMDLGGNAPVIVMNDCNLELAVSSCVSGAFWAAGQNCIGVQRIYVHHTVFDLFTERFIAQTNAMNVGDPMITTIDLGPMINEAQAQRIETWVDAAIEQGAKVLTGHQRHGALYEPTVLTHVPMDAKVFEDEVFAPVVILEPYENFGEVIELANQTECSLHAGIFTNSMNKALQAIERLEFSGVMVNDSSDFRFDAMPFGGYKKGSLGREGVRYALEEMTQTKVVCFNRDHDEREDEH
ncbi:aldehyde dehydrogenase family protein [Marinomonas mediterranea]|uniref:aldehyde dehydrogenase family protein n=1 Tax=Marinomonas mediterranea TaxID=119864 RepID=UPI00234A20D8|nr:aldehyde dehydrogenase family protein [Marinomonas mediterranea]WCN15138.1 aldehyde dehydrogenase family protein [Marinomonas mediterranea]